MTKTLVLTFYWATLYFYQANNCSFTLLCFDAVEWLTEKAPTFTNSTSSTFHKFTFMGWYRPNSSNPQKVGWLNKIQK